MVRGINRDQSRPAIGIDFRGYGERTLPRAQDMPGILEQNVVCLCDPVGFRETLAQRRKFLVRKPQRGLQALLLRLYPLLAAFMLVTKPRSEERRVGKEWVSTGNSRGSAEPDKVKQHKRE